jgi:hypothetical protein
MALRFTCEHCGKEITVKFLKAGDKALCRKCGNYSTVPGDAAPTDEVPEYSARSSGRPRTPREAEAGRRVGEKEPEIGDLGPRTLEGFVRETFRVYGDEFFRFMAVIVAPTVLLYALGYIPNHLAERLMAAGAEFSIDRLLPMLPLAMLYALAALVVSVLMQGALIHTVSHRYVKGVGGVGKAYAFAWARILHLIGARILASLVLLAICAVGVGLYVALRNMAGLPGLGVLVIIVFGCAVIYLAIRWTFIEQAVLLEKCGPLSSLSRSSAHVENHWWRILGIMFVIGLIIGVAAFILSLILTLTLRDVGSLIIQMLTAPFTAIITTLLYFDIRVRKEGYRHSNLADALGVRADDGTLRNTQPKAT